MFLTVHATAALFIARAVPFPPAAFAAGLASHFLLDAIPHGDDTLFNRFSDDKKTKAIGVAGAIDILVLSGWFIWLVPQLTLEPSALWAIAGSVLPDILSGVYLLTHWSWLRWNYELNNRAHRLFTKKSVPFSTGLLIQAVTLGLLYWLLV